MKRAQDLIRELVKTEACLHAGKEADDARIKALEAEIETLRTEQKHESSVHSRRTASRGGVDDTKEEAEREDHRRARDLLASKLKEREAQLAALRHEAEENRKLAKDLEAGQKRIRSLEAEVGKMAAQSETLRARIKDDDPFIDTLDYIFVTDDVEVVDVLDLPHRDQVKGPFPAATEPSDHIMLAATIRVK